MHTNLSTQFKEESSKKWREPAAVCSYLMERHREDEIRHLLEIGGTRPTVNEH